MAGLLVEPVCPLCQRKPLILKDMNQLFSNFLSKICTIVFALLNGSNLFFMVGLIALASTKTNDSFPLISQIPELTIICAILLYFFVRESLYWFFRLAGYHALPELQHFGLKGTTRLPLFQKHTPTYLTLYRERNRSITFLFKALLALIAGVAGAVVHFLWHWFTFSFPAMLGGIWARLAFFGLCILSYLFYLFFKKWLLSCFVTNFDVTVSLTEHEMPIFSNKH